MIWGASSCTWTQREGSHAHGIGLKKSAFPPHATRRHLCQLRQRLRGAVTHRYGRRQMWSSRRSTPRMPNLARTLASDPPSHSPRLSRSWPSDFGVTYRPSLVIPTKLHTENSSMYLCSCAPRSGRLHTYADTELDNRRNLDNRELFCTACFGRGCRTCTQTQHSYSSTYLHACMHTDGQTYAHTDVYPWVNTPCIHE